MQLNLQLKARDKIALICPGSICTDSRHPQMTQDYLQKNYQLEAIFTHDTTQGLPAKERAAIFLDYLLNDEIKLIAALRGGEGTADILPYIHQHHDKIKSLSPKFLLGHSDFTALLVYFDKYYHWPVIHGASLRQLATGDLDKQSEQMTMDLLFGAQEISELSLLKPLNDFARVEKNIEATLTGGNLSVIDISIKDIWEIETKNKILFFEDVGEKAHKIIRTLKYFSRIHLFKDIKAVIFGDFISTPIGCQPKEQENNQVAILKTLSGFARHHDFPVLYTEQFGHGRVNLPLIYSVKYHLQLGENAALRLSYITRS